MRRCASRRLARFALLAATDLAAFLFAVLAAQLLLRNLLAGWSRGGALLVSALLVLQDMAVASVLFLLVAVRLYRSGRYGVQVEAAGRVTYLPRYCALAFLAHGTVVLLFGVREGHMLAVWAVLPPAAASLRRLAGAAFRETGLLSVRTLLAGSSLAVGAAGSVLGNGAASGLEVVGVALCWPGAPPASTWRGLLARHDAEMVVMAVQGQDDEQPMLRSLQGAGVPAATLIVLDGAARPPLPRPREPGGPARRIGLHPAEHVLKSAIDFASALALLALLAPAMLLLAALVKFDGGPVLFKHERVGLRGRMFHCLKFRTMAPDGDTLLQDLLAHDPQARQEWNATRKLRRDPRVTAVGRFLRATSMDELPQLLNILQGEMSLVGPRPVVPVELPRYGAGIAYYLSAKPGLTGLWQVSGRSSTSYERRVQLDIAYVRDWSFWADLRILVQTFPVVLLRRGAV